MLRVLGVICLVVIIITSLGSVFIYKRFLDRLYEYRTEAPRQRDKVKSKTK